MTQAVATTWLVTSSDGMSLSAHVPVPEILVFAKVGIRSWWKTPLVMLSALKFCKFTLISTSLLPINPVRKL